MFPVSRMNLSLTSKPGVKSPGGIKMGCFLLVTATHITITPTQITTTVATTGTITFKSIQSGRPGIALLPEPSSLFLLVLVPKGGAIVP